jgi:quinoprotein glucose dehydrogenase
MSFTPDEMVTAEDTTPEHAAACRDLWDRSGGFRNEGPYTPFLFKEHDEPPVTTVQFPGAGGGVNWGGVATDPTTGYVFVNSSDSSLAGWIEEKIEGGNYGRNTQGSDQPHDRASVGGPGPYAGFNARVEDSDGNFIGSLPCQKPPWSRLIAVNANTGDIAWETPLGINLNLPEGKQNVGGSGSAGPTATGGGLVFVGATNDRRFRAFDSSTGDELWTATLDGNGGSNPITYMGPDGKQYVGIVASGQFVTFTLP